MARASMPIVLIAMCCLTACQTTPVDKTDEQASVALTDLKTSEVIFAYAVNKQNAFRGRQSAAESCAKHLKARIEGKE